MASAEAAETGSTRGCFEATGGGQAEGAQRGGQGGGVEGGAVMWAAAGDNTRNISSARQ